jgi:hypothetical protein
MKRLLAVPALVVGALALAAFALADPGNHGHGHGNKQPHPNRATVTIQTTDHGCAGNVWATDTIKRTVKVHKFNNGSYRIREYDRGSFTTTADGALASPGNCPENTSSHGLTVLPNITGHVKGYIRGRVTGGTFNPTATCSSPCTQSDFIKAFFGSAATFSCLSNSPRCKFNYGYHAKLNQNLKFRYWRDRGRGGGTFLKEHFFGDIASA